MDIRPAATPPSLEDQLRANPRWKSLAFSVGTYADDSQDALEALSTVLDLISALNAYVDEQVMNCIHSGVSQAEIGRLLGVSRQAIHKKYVADHDSTTSPEAS